EDVRRVGLAHSVPGLADPTRVLGLYPAQAQRDADLPEDEGRGERLQGAADRELPPLPQQQIRAAGAPRRDGGSRRGMVYGTVLCAVLPAADPEAGLHSHVYSHRSIAGDRDAVL